MRPHGLERVPRDDEPGVELVGAGVHEPAGDPQGDIAVVALDDDGVSDAGVQPARQLGADGGLAGARRPSRRHHRRPGALGPLVGRRLGHRAAPVAPHRDRAVVGEERGAGAHRVDVGVAPELLQDSRRVVNAEEAHLQVPIGAEQAGLGQEVVAGAFDGGDADEPADEHGGARDPGQAAGHSPAAVALQREAGPEPGHGGHGSGQAVDDREAPGGPSRVGAPARTVRQLVKSVSVATISSTRSAPRTTTGASTHRPEVRVRQPGQPTREQRRHADGQRHRAERAEDDRGREGRGGGEDLTSPVEPDRAQGLLVRRRAASAARQRLPDDEEAGQAGRHGEDAQDGHLDIDGVAHALREVVLVDGRRDGEVRPDGVLE